MVALTEHVFIVRNVAGCCKATGSSLTNEGKRNRYSGFTAKKAVQ